MAYDSSAGSFQLAPLDRTAIEELLAAYVLSLDVGDVDAAAELFTEDGVFETYGHRFVGRERVRRMFASAPAGLHLAGSSLIFPDNEGVKVRQQLVFFPAARSVHRLAIYDDVVIPDSAGWLFQSRRCRFINGNGDLVANPD